MVGGRGLLALMLVLAMTSLGQALPVAPAPDWLQYGGDAANTGAGSSGPERPEVALRVQLPLGRAYFAAPLVVGRDAFVLAAAPPGTDAGPDDGIYRISLDTGTAERWAALDVPGSAFGSDGERLLVTTSSDVRAFALHDRAALWSVPHPSVLADQERVSCPFIKIRDGVAYVACTAQGTAAGNPVYGEAGEVTSALFVRALDVSSGTVVWTWVKDVAGQAARENVQSQEALAPTSAPFVTYLNGLAVIGPYVIVTGIDGVWDGGFAEVYAWALDAQEGTTLWRRGSSEARSMECGSSCVIKNAAEPTGTSSLVFLKLDTLLAVNPARNTVLWEQDLSGQDTQAAEFGAGFALSDGSLFAASRETLYRFRADAQGTGENWSPLDAADEHVWTSQHLHVAEGTVFARSRHIENREQNTIRAYDVVTGEARWELPLIHEGPGFADLQFMTSLGPGVIVAAGVDGSVHVIGRTAASLVPTPTVSDSYPKPGAEVTVSLTASATTIGSAASEWRIDWGDGTVDEWTAEDSFRHAYGTTGQVRALIQGRNGAGQVGATYHVFDVGGSAPADPGIVDWLLDNQDTAWGLLGLLTAVGGALLALWRRRVRRRFMRGELLRIQQAFHEAGVDPARGHAAQVACRQRVESLLLDGRIDETQATLLARHIDDHARSAQARTLDERLAFLPHAFVMRLRRAMSDGSMAAAERTELISTLETSSLSADERAMARAFVDAWHGAAGGPAPTTP